MTDSSGTVVWSAEYSAFGQALVTVSTVTNNLRFPGQYFDEETGLHYNWKRYYDPATGRYTQVDPIGFDAEDVNLYRYVENNPTYWIDPEGEMGGAAAALGGVGIVAGGALIALVPPAAAVVTIVTIGTALVALVPTSVAVDPPMAGPMCSKGREQNVRDTGLVNVPDAEIQRRARDKELSKKERRRYQKEEKARGERNKQKRGNKK